jgi:hypothetical protein
MLKLAFIHLRRPGRLPAAVTALACTAGAIAGPSAAATSSSVNATIPVAAQIKSVAISPSTITFANCGPSGNLGSGQQLLFPNGTCSAPGISVGNNGTVPEAILVEGTSAVPSDNGTPWVLSATKTPPTDSYALTLLGSTQIFLASGPQTDANAPNGGVSVLPGTNDIEAPQIYGPSASTDPSTTFTATVTWIAS